MNFTVNIHTDGAAFHDNVTGEHAPTPELVRILRRIAIQMELGEPYDMFQTIYDTNGNDVGRFALKPTPIAFEYPRWPS